MLDLDRAGSGEIEPPSPDSGTHSASSPMSVVEFAVSPVAVTVHRTQGISTSASTIYAALILFKTKCLLVELYVFIEN